VSTDTITFFAASPSTTGSTRAQFLLDRRRLRARPGRFTADIDEVGALRNETQAIVDGLRCIEAFTAV